MHLLANLLNNFEHLSFGYSGKPVDVYTVSKRFFKNKLKSDGLVKVIYVFGDTGGECV